MNPAILDTDTLSEIVKDRNPVVSKNAVIYKRIVGPLTVSAFTEYQIIRGHKRKRATSQLARFRAFCQGVVILPVDEDIWERTSDLWALARSKGLPCEDADLAIAATALVHGRELVTGNTAHFAWIPGLTLIDRRVL